MRVWRWLVLGALLASGATAQSDSWLGGAKKPPPARRPPAAVRPPEAETPPARPGEEEALVFTPRARVRCGTRVATPLDRVSPKGGHEYASFQARSAVWLRGAVVLGHRDNTRGALVLSGGPRQDGALHPTSYHPLRGSQEMWRVDVDGEAQILTRDLHTYRLLVRQGKPELVHGARFGFPTQRPGWHFCGQGSGGVSSRAVAVRGREVAVFDLRRRPQEDWSAHLPFVADRGVFVPSATGGELYLTERVGRGRDATVRVHRVVVRDVPGEDFGIEARERTRLEVAGWIPHLVRAGEHVYAGVEGQYEGVLQGQVYRVARQGVSLELLDPRPGDVRAMLGAESWVLSGGQVYRPGTQGVLRKWRRVEGPRTRDGFPYFGDAVGGRVVFAESGEGDGTAARVHCLR